MEGRYAYFETFFQHGNSSVLKYPLELTVQITKRYVDECNERSWRTGDKKTRVTFKHFYKEVKQEYMIDGVRYTPSLSFVQRAIKSMGHYSQLCTHKTKMSVSKRANALEKFIQKNRDFLKKIGEEEFISLGSKIKMPKITKKSLR